MNRQPYGIPPRRWEPKLNSRFVRVTRSPRRRQLARRQQIIDVRVKQAECFQLPIRQGAASIALAAERHYSQPVVVVPCAIRFQYVDDPTAALVTAMNSMEQRVSGKLAPNNTLPQRVLRLGATLLTIIDKFEENVLGKDEPGIRSRRRVYVRFGDAIEAAGFRGYNRAAEPTESMQSAVQKLHVQKEQSTRLPSRSLHLPLPSSNGPDTINLDVRGSVFGRKMPYFYK